MNAHHPRVGWFELFYDLVMVAAVIHGSDLFAERPTFANGFWLAVTLLILSILWLLTVVTFNAMREDWGLRRILVLAQMLAVVIASLATSRDGGLSDTVGFLALAAAFGTAAGVYALLARRATFDAGSLRVVALTTGGSAVVLVAGSIFSSQPVALAPGLCLGIALGLALLPLFSVLLGRACSSGWLDREHLGERMGQLVIIVLGESFVRLVLALHREEEIPSPIFLVLTFVVVYCLWVVYFRGVLPAGVPRTAGRLRTWLAAHYLFMLGAIGAASGLAALTLEPLDLAVPETAPYRTALPLIYAMTALALLAWLGRERTGPEYRVHLTAAALLLLTVLAGVTVVPASDWTTSIACVIVIGDAIAVSWLRRRQHHAHGSGRGMADAALQS